MLWTATLYFAATYGIIKQSMSFLSLFCCFTAVIMGSVIYLCDEVCGYVLLCMAVKKINNKKKFSNFVFVSLLIVFKNAGEKTCKTLHQKDFSSNT
jgi:hypothetical protein